jgi:hypothetical protein
VYGTETLALLRVLPGTVRGDEDPATESSNADEDTSPAESVTCTETVKFPGALGVPVMAPEN